MSAGSGKRKKATYSGGEESGAGEVGRLVDCSQADDRRMIRLVRERPLLYARNNMPVASYYAHVKKLWQQVADLMGWTGTNTSFCLSTTALCSSCHRLKLASRNCK